MTKLSNSIVQKKSFNTIPVSGRSCCEALLSSPYKEGLLPQVPPKLSFLYPTYLQVKGYRVHHLKRKLTNQLSTLFFWYRGVPVFLYCEHMHSRGIGAWRHLLGLYQGRANIFRPYLWEIPILVCESHSLPVTMVKPCICPDPDSFPIYFMTKLTSANVKCYGIFNISELDYRQTKVKLNHVTARNIYNAIFLLCA